MVSDLRSMTMGLAMPNWLWPVAHRWLKMCGSVAGALRPSTANAAAPAARVPAERKTLQNCAFTESSHQQDNGPVNDLWAHLWGK